MKLKITSNKSGSLNIANYYPNQRNEPFISTKNSQFHITSMNYYDINTIIYYIYICNIIQLTLAFKYFICYLVYQNLLLTIIQEATCQEPAKTQKLSIHIKTIDKHLEQVDLDKIALTSKFYQRKPQKITAFVFIKSLCNAAYFNLFSYSKVAFLIGLLGVSVTKQAVGDRINRYAAIFLKQVLNAVINNISGLHPVHKIGAFKTFQKVYIQDSTHLPLPQNLASFYPGPKNQSKKKFAGMKIQAIFNLANEQLIDFSLSPFTRTDQDASKDIIKLVKENDLVIRDLGYFTLSVFKKLIKKGVFFLSRFKNNVALYHIKSQQRINLLDLLKKQSSLDIDVLLGVKDRLPVRLVALPVPDHIANERRRKAKMNRDRRCNPSKESLQLLGWQIFITTVGRDIWTPSTICNVYAIRWRIEIIFKAWKSHLSLNIIPQKVNKNELEAYIYSLLLNITFFHVFFDQLNRYMIHKYSSNISILKIAPLFDQIIKQFFLFGDILKRNQPMQFLEQLILKHCCYEKRKNRINYSQQLEYLYSLA